VKLAFFPGRVTGQWNARDAEGAMGAARMTMKIAQAAAIVLLFTALIRPPKR
jgi:hypothetical protein